VVAFDDLKEQHWQDLCAAINLEQKQIGGFGGITVRIEFQHGAPITMRVLERQAVYRLGHQAAPLTEDKL